MRPRARKAPPLGIVLDPTRSEPLHRQIGEQLRRAILERRLAPGTKLPSSRLMAKELDCARGTVLLAVDQLIAEGYLVTQAGSGISVAANLPEEMLVSPSVDVPPAGGAADEPILSRRAVELLATGLSPQAPFGDPAIAFPLGQPDREAFPYRLWAKLLEQEWRKPSWQVAGAPHPFGHPGLREAIASYLGIARGFACDPRAVVVTSGLRQSIATLARMVLDTGDAAWIEDPGFRGTREGLAAADVRTVPVPVDASGFSLDAALALAPEARLAVVAPSHQFPLGIVLGLQRRLELLSWAERTRSWIVEDDFDGEYRYSGRPLAPLRALDRSGRVAYLGSFSKLMFPTLRLSFLILPASLVDAAEKIMVGVSPRASLLGQGALARFIAEGHLAAHLRRTRLLYASRQQVLIASAQHHLAGLLEVTPDPAGMHVVARPHAALAPTFDDVSAVASAAAASVSVASLSACYVGAKKEHGLILGYAGTPEVEIERAIARLRSALRGHY
ncbi:PLP-dependent aminotransferase family protein [Reyranella sp.]|uniref:MocR-like pyridoxine biosynthesis transcription factor PdxR n=1 Tax=Reyranella sp. TaxID=1929291 RepID=UPI0011FC28D3|nr:PLP-dependent aminotransferase family protein [Reyranella sp.]TAJ90817.1 MAG: PLP-dependent aminotransferase family protein [Reyranella sp.]